MMIRYVTACYLLLLFALQTHGFAPQTHGGIVEIAVEEPTGVARQSWPVTSGIPLAAGQLQEQKAAALFAEDGRELPLQTEALARWPDGSVRWLLLDFQVDLQAKQKRTLMLRYGKEIRRTSVADPLDVDQTDDGVVIRTGPMRLAIARGGCPLPGQVSLDLDRDGRFAPEEQITDPDSPGVVLIDEEGREFSTAAGPVEISVEQSGPMRACVRLAGQHVAGDGHKFRYIARIHAYRGRSALRIYYTFINDCQQPLMSRFKSLDFVMRRKTADGPTLLGGKVASSGTLLQVDENQYVIDGKPAGRRALGWVASGGKRAGMALGLREFWQNWPKGLEVGPDQIKIGICPAFPKGLYD
ncbi:MAG: hypothetical protein U9N87_08545, partial [Planctomycetota bacterium]|nr:hypothetical protein [Planctomycetota bacterium]